VLRSTSIVMVLAIATGLAVWKLSPHSAGQQGPTGKPHGPGGPIPVTAAVARVQAVPVWISALGTVTPRNYVNVMPRVSGLLQTVDYREGQMVNAGQLLAQIDRRPFEIAVEQASAQLLRDQAQLDGAKRDLARYETLLAQNSIAHQQVDDQKALVAQYMGTTAADRAALDNAKLQLTYTRITAPISGRTGLRLVDAGNLVNTSGAVGGGTQSTSGTGGSGNNTPIVTLAQVQPITATFAIPQQQIGPVLQLLHAGEQLPVEAWDARGTARLANGKLLAADNQINTATGTLNFKAEFGNDKLTLFPNQFVNVRLHVDTLANAVVVPSTAVAVGAPGTYVYVVGSDNKVAVRAITTGGSTEGLTVVSAGLQAGERVVTDGLDRLRAGAMVRVVEPQAGEKAGHAGGRRPPQRGPVKGNGA
jgi:multidrug efflux system membrane fusion protein